MRGPTGEDRVPENAASSQADVEAGRILLRAPLSELLTCRRIPNGSWCLFGPTPKGSRNGRVVIAQHRDISDPDTGGQFTVKVYESHKAEAPEGSWRHQSIVLRPDTTSPGFEPLVLSPDEADDLRIVAELLAVLA